MKKEFSFYEFVGILVPGVTFLYFTEIILEISVSKKVIDFSKIGESFIFLIIAYGFGHILQAIGNLFESILWNIYGGRPTNWLTKENRFKTKLFSSEINERIKGKIYSNLEEVKDKDYGREIYNLLSLKENITEKRIDIFNANYSLFRGLTVTFYGMTILTLLLPNWYLMFIPLILGILSNVRMVKFGKLYARELFLTYYNL